jgi:hypothetical protein
MKKSLSVAVLWAACVIPAFACEKPAAPASLPDGKTAAMEEMMAAKKTVDAYKKSVEEYLACERSQSSKVAAHAELESVANKFNEQVRAFKAKG